MPQTSTLASVMYGAWGAQGGYLSLAQQEQQYLQQQQQQQQQQQFPTAIYHAELNNPYGGASAQFSYSTSQPYSNPQLPAHPYGSELQLNQCYAGKGDQYSNDALPPQQGFGWHGPPLPDQTQGHALPPPDDQPPLPSEQPPLPGEPPMPIDAPFPGHANNYHAGLAHHATGGWNTQHMSGPPHGVASHQPGVHAQPPFPHHPPFPGYNSGFPPQPSPEHQQQQQNQPSHAPPQYGYANGLQPQQPVPPLEHADSGPRAHNQQFPAHPPYTPEAAPSQPEQHQQPQPSLPAYPHGRAGKTLGQSHQPHPPQPQQLHTVPAPVMPSGMHSQPQQPQPGTGYLPASHALHAATQQVNGSDYMPVGAANGRYMASAQPPLPAQGTSRDVRPQQPPIPAAHQQYQQHHHPEPTPYMPPGSGASHTHNHLTQNQPPAHYTPDGMNGHSQQHQHQQPCAVAGPAPATAAAVKQSLEALRPVVDITTLLRPPGRYQRPPRLLLILRGLPGSGKSHLARKIREVETQEGGEAPRMHSLDEYFMAEVEKEVEEEGPRGRPRKRKVTETEYQYDADMEASYQKSLVRSVWKTLEEGRFPLVIMDAPNLKLADFMDVLPATQRHRYVTYVLQPLESDPVLCARRNTHGHSEAFVARLAGSWEPAPSALQVLDARPLLQGKVQGASAIQEVDMDDNGPGEAADDGDVGAGGTASASAAGNSSSIPAAPTSAALSSRWAQADDTAGGNDDKAEEKGAKGRKKARTSSASDNAILEELSIALANGGADGEAGADASSLLAREADMLEALAAARRTLRRSKRVRWCDDPEGEGSEDKGAGQGAGGGFRMRASARPLCEVHVLEGLGPARGDTALVYMDSTSPLMSARYGGSFADAVKAEHSKEHQLLAAIHDGDGATVPPAEDE